MTKFLHDDVLDGLLNYIKNNVVEITLCNAEPTTYTQAHTTYMLVNQVLDTGDFTISNGDTNGRKVRVGAQAGLTPTNGGSAIYVALTDTVNSKLLGYTTCPSKTFDTSDLVDIAAFDCEVADPV